MKFGLVSLLLPLVASLCPLEHSNQEAPILQDNPIAIARMVSPDSARIDSQGAPLLSDIIGLKQCTIMRDYTMNLESVARRLMDPAAKTLLLAPLNSAIVALPQKPWKDGPEDATDPKISPLRNEDRAAKNIEAFVTRHVIASYPLKDGDHAKSLSGQEVVVESRDEERFVNGKHKVLTVKEAANGAIWVIDGVIEPAAKSGHHEGL